MGAWRRLGAWPWKEGKRGEGKRGGKEADVCGGVLCCCFALFMFMLGGTKNNNPIGFRLLTINLYFSMRTFFSFNSPRLSYLAYI